MRAQHKLTMTPGLIRDETPKTRAPAQNRVGDMQCSKKICFLQADWQADKEASSPNHLICSKHTTEGTRNSNRIEHNTTNTTTTNDNNNHTIEGSHLRHLWLVARDRWPRLRCPAYSEEYADRSITFPKRSPDIGYNMRRSTSGRRGGMRDVTREEVVQQLHDRPCQGK